MTNYEKTSLGRVNIGVNVGANGKLKQDISSLRNKKL